MRALETHEYSELSVEQRLDVIVALCHMAIDGPSIRVALEGRIEESSRIRKQMWEEGKVRSGWACRSYG